LACWELRFKPEVDDIRDWPALSVASASHIKGATVRVHDLPGQRQCAASAPGGKYTDAPGKACEGADLVLYLTEWAGYRELDPAKLLAVVRKPRVLDGRHADPLAQWRAGWTVRSMGVAVPA
jgi:UDPglucose 6-dehydrogenase